MTPDLSTLASRQLGLVTRAQAATHGYSAAMVRARLRRGRWLLAPDVFLVSGSPVTWPTKVLAACLATGGMASHRSAAALHDVEGFRPGRVEISVARGAPGSRVAVPEVTVHRSGDLEGCRPVMVGRVPTTGAARLAVDLGAVVPRWRHERAVDDLIARRLLTWDDAVDALLAHARRGRRGVGALRELIERRGGDDVPASVLERAFVRLLRRRGLPEPVLQHEILDQHGFAARVDIAYVTERVAIELDGLRWHLPAQTFEADHRKRARLTAAGWTVLAFTWRMVTDDPDGVVASLRSVLGRERARNMHSDGQESNAASF
jgi:very-short-patch-repair endonuclease